MCIYHATIIVTLDNIWFYSKIYINVHVTRMAPDELMQLSDKKQIILLEAKSYIKADKCYWLKELGYLKLLKKHK